MITEVKAVLPTLLLALFMAATQVPDAAAQKFSVRPQVGIYIPTKDIVAVTQGGDVSKISAGPSFGAALGLRLGKRFEIGVAGAYVPTTFNVTTSGQIAKQNAKLFLGNALATFYLLPPTGLLSLFVNGGAGVVSHGGVAFTSQAKTSEIGGVFGAGAGLNLGGISLVAATDFFTYTASYEGSQQTAAKAKQLDIQIRFGLGFGGR